MKRVFDFSGAAILLVIFSLPIVLISIAIKITSRGPAIYFSDRVGIYNKIFKMPKFRSMRVDTPAVATHLLDNPDNYVTPLGRFLRRTSLDELPQLWCILIGDMSFVGPRPALFNQYDLIKLRTDCGVSRILPGLTGLAQVSGRDNLSTEDKVKFDLIYLNKKSIIFDMLIFWKTILKVLKKEDVVH